MSEDTKVQFSLWAVLTFLVILGGLSLGYLFDAQGRMRDKQQQDNQEICERTAKLEANIVYIVEGIKELKDGQIRVVNALSEQEKTTRDLRNATKTVKRWQDYPSQRAN